MADNFEDLIMKDDSISLFIKRLLVRIVKTNNQNAVYMAELRLDFEDVVKVLKDKGIIEGT